MANDKILAFDCSVVLVWVAPVKISPALIEQISKETGLKIGGRLFSDTLSERGGPAISYVAMFKHNLGAIMTLQASGSWHQRDDSTMPKGRAWFLPPQPIPRKIHTPVSCWMAVFS